MKRRTTSFLYFYGSALARNGIKIYYYSLENHEHSIKIIVITDYFLLFLFHQTREEKKNTKFKNQNWNKLFSNAFSEFGMGWVKRRLENWAVHYIFLMEQRCDNNFLWISDEALHWLTINLLFLVFWQSSHKQSILLQLGSG